jgi:hypothetical protein
MKNSAQNKERRLHPRLDRNLPINVAANGYDFFTTTHNISCVGAYCHIEKYVPPFTKVKIKLNLPVSVNGSKQDYGVECHGVIVRTEDEAAGGFNVAIFFNEIKEHFRQKIAHYISGSLPANPYPSN